MKRDGERFEGAAVEGGSVPRCKPRVACSHQDVEEVRDRLSPGGPGRSSAL